MKNESIFFLLGVEFLFLLSTFRAHINMWNYRVSTLGIFLSDFIISRKLWGKSAQKKFLLLYEHKIFHYTHAGGKDLYDASDKIVLKPSFSFALILSEFLWMKCEENDKICMSVWKFSLSTHHTAFLFWFFFIALTIYVSRFNVLFLFFWCWD